MVKKLADIYIFSVENNEQEMEKGLKTSLNNLNVK